MGVEYVYGSEWDILLAFDGESSLTNRYLNGAGEDNILGTDDDVTTPLDTYTRTIAISEIVNNGTPNPSLRRLVVTIGYRVGSSQRTYTLTTFISRIS